MPLNGLLLVDKPEGWTSHDVVAKIRKLLRQKSVGHSGTLDPMASGLLVILLGEATKLSDYMRAGEKVYWAKVRLGVTTDTLDKEGEVLSKKEVSLNPQQVAAAVAQAEGPITLPVPLYSAVKVKGQKLYDYARSGQSVEPPLKLMSFEDLAIEEVGPDYVSLRMRCSQGSYVRAWAAHLGEMLGTGAILEALRREASGPYGIAQALSVEELGQKLDGQEPMAWPQELGKAFIPLAETLPDWHSLVVSGRDERLLRHGQISREVSSRLIVHSKEATRQGQSLGVKVISSEDKGGLLALLEARPLQGLKIRRVFPPQATCKSDGDGVRNP